MLSGNLIDVGILPCADMAIWFSRAKKIWVWPLRVTEKLELPEQAVVAA
jgi:hypothetical protein